MSCTKARSNYSQINHVGPAASSAPVNNPLSTALSSGLDNMLMHGSNRIDVDSEVTQAYMAEYLAKHFDTDPMCKLVCMNNEPQYFPNQYHSSSNIGNNNNALAPRSKMKPNPRVQQSKGDVFLLNAARAKYLSRMRNGQLQRVPFDDTVANSPKVSIWTGLCMIPEYSIPATVNPDTCGILCQLMKRPWIALPFMQNVYETMRSNQSLGNIAGTRIGNYFNFTFEDSNPGTDLGKFLNSTLQPPQGGSKWSVH